MTENGNALAITAFLAPSIVPSADTERTSACRRVEAELRELFAALGVAAQPEVELAEEETEHTHRLVSVGVAGRPCAFPSTTVAEALSYVEGKPAADADSDALLAGVSALNGTERLGELLAHICRAAISARPTVLLAGSDEPVVAALLELGIAIPPGGTDEAPRAAESAEDAIAAGAAKTIDVHIHPGYLRTLSAEDADGELFPFLRSGLFEELGLPLPPFSFKPDASLRPAGLAFQINALRTLPRIGLAPGTILVNDTPERLELLAVEGTPAINPAGSQPMAIVGEEHKEVLEGAGLTTWTPFGFLMLALAAAVRRRAHALMTRSVADGLVTEMGFAFPFLAGAARENVPPEDLAPVLRDLLRDGLSIRNLRRILELLLRHRDLVAGGRGADPIGFVRSGLADATAFNLGRGTGTVVVYLIDPELERTLNPARVAGALRAELAELPPSVAEPALLTHDQLRRPLRDILSPEFPHVAVVGYGDLPPSVNLQPIARIA